MLCSADIDNSNFEELNQLYGDKNDDLFKDSKPLIVFVQSDVCFFIFVVVPLILVEGPAITPYRICFSYQQVQLLGAASGLVSR